MPGISIANIGVPFKSGFSWRAYWKTLVSATVEGAQPTHVVLTFSKANTNLVASDFIITGFTISSLSRDGTNKILTLVLSTAVIYGDPLVMTFLKSGGTHAVTNNVTAETEYTTYLAAFTGTSPSLTIKRAQNKLIKYWKGANPDSRNIYAKMACFIPLGWGVPTLTDALRWLTNPARSGSASVTPPVYNPRNGVTGNGVSAYVDSTCNPSTDGAGLFTQNNNSFGYGFSNDRRSGQAGIHGLIISPSGGCFLTPMLSAKVYSNDGISPTTNFASTQTLPVNFIISRGTTYNYIVYANKTALSTVSKSSLANQNKTFYILADNAASGAVDFSKDTVDYFLAGSNFDQTDINVFDDGWNTLKSEIFNDYTAGIVLSFDDINRLPSWVAADAVLAPLGWKPTFSINAADQATLAASASDIIYLKNAGYEIVNHSVNHIAWDNYIIAHGAQSFYDVEIAPLQVFFQNVFGWQPESYAYAQIEGDNQDLDRIIWDAGFKHVRPSYPGPPPDYMPIINRKGSFMTWSNDIWDYSQINHQSVLNILQYAKNNNLIVHLYGHTIGGEGDPDSQFVVSRDLIIDICNFVNVNGMRFYTMSELPY